MKVSAKITPPNNVMKPKTKIKSPQQRKRSSILYVPSPRFILVPFYGHQLRAVLDGEEILYLREDVFRVFELRECPRWNRILYPNQRRTLLVPDGDGAATEYKVVNEAGFYKILSLRESNLGDKFNLKGGSRIQCMSRTDQTIGDEQRKFYRKILRDLHASWRQDKMSDCNIDEWEMVRRGAAKTWLLN